MYFQTGEEIFFPHILAEIKTTSIYLIHQRDTEPFHLRNPNITQCIHARQYISLSELITMVNYKTTPFANFKHK